MSSYQSPVASRQFLVLTRRGFKRSLRFIITTLLMLICSSVLAQDSPAPVTDDDVNSVAQQMYCPVCENIPLDVCPTDACKQWRDEIRTQLEAGLPPDEIIKGFVARYGDQVVGTPQDPTLRALSLVTPWIIAVGVIGLALTVLWRWRRNPTIKPAPAEGIANQTDEDYRARLERDLTGRR